MLKKKTKLEHMHYLILGITTKLQQSRERGTGERADTLAHSGV